MVGMLGRYNTRLMIAKSRWMRLEKSILSHKLGALWNMILYIFRPLSIFKGQPNHVDGFAVRKHIDTYLSTVYKYNLVTCLHQLFPLAKKETSALQMSPKLASRCI